MGIIRDLIPLNTDEEKEKFLADDSYNPQFAYVREFQENELNHYDQPQEEYFKHAEKMISLYGIPELSKKKNGQAQVCPTATQEEILSYLDSLFEKLTITPLEAYFSEDFNSQVMISKDGLHFRLPLSISKENLKHKLNHEVQSHYLRRYNQKLQSWNLESEKKHPREFRTTEEGLANLHSYIEREDLVMRKTYLNYYAAYLSQQLSFRQLYNELLALGAKNELAWNLTLKQKRGLKDTGQPGGYAKNHVYFEGTVKVWNWLMNPANKPEHLYWGRLALIDLPEAASLPINQHLVIPTFMRDTTTYRERISELGEINKFSALKIYI